MVARRSSYEPIVRELLFEYAHDGVECSADLVRGGRLYDFEFAEDIGIGPRQPLGEPQRRPLDGVGDPLRGAGDVLPGNRDGHESEARMSARFMANADRGRTWSAPARFAALMRST